MASLTLDDDERAIAAGRRGAAAAMAMRIVADAGELLGAERLLPIRSAHIDGCLYHGDSGTVFAERLVADGARVAVPTTLNIGALDLIRPGNVRLGGPSRDMALRLMRAYEAMGCRPTWTCSPYQAGHRPAAGDNVAWGESNAVAFCNSVLGARTNRYGDFLDIACALVGRAPAYGLHLAANRYADVLVETAAVSDALKARDVFWPVLGAWYGKTFGEAVGALDGLAAAATEDRLKAFGAAAAAFGSVALFHVVGVTPEAPSRERAFGGRPPRETVQLTPATVRDALAWLSTATGTEVDAVGIGSPHLSLGEFRTLAGVLRGRRVRLPFYANTGRHVVKRLETEGLLPELEAAGLTIVADTCIVAAPILPPAGGVLMTNSGKFAHYAPGNIGYQVLYGSLEDCVETAVSGRLVRDDRVWR